MFSEPFSNDPAVAGFTVQENTGDPFETALTRYMVLLTQVSAALLEQQQQALAAYMQASKEVLPPDVSAVTAIQYQELMNAVQNGAANEIAAAQTAYLELLAKIQNTISNDSRVLFDEYLKQLRIIWDAARSECLKGYLEYVAGISVALVQAAAQGLDPVALATIAKGMSTVASYASTVAHYFDERLGTSTPSDPLVG